MSVERSKSAGSASATPVLSIEELHVWFELPGGGELHAVRGVDVSLEPGERLGLVGESGCGKSTLLLSILGLLPSTASVSGRVVFAGEDLMSGGEAAFRPHRWRDISMVFQGSMHSLNPVQTIGTQIEEPMRLHQSFPRQSMPTQAEHLLEKVGLAPTLLDHYPHELSGGMRQRASIAMALACGPQVLLADEPTTALDVIAQAQIMELLVSLTDELHLGLIVVSHDLSLIAEACTRIAVLYAGQIVEVGPTKALLSNPQHPYTARLLAATPDITRQRHARAIPGVPPRLDQPVVGCAFAPRCQLAESRCHTTIPQPVDVAPGHVALCHMASAYRPDETPGVDDHELHHTDLQ